MEFKQGQLVVILSPFTYAESYGNIKTVSNELLTLTVNIAGFLKEGWDILCILLDNSDVYEFYSKVESLNGSNVTIKTPVSEGLCKVEKRKFSRAECQIGFVARPLIINNISVAKSGKTFTGVIKNISAGGVLVETDLCFPKDSVFGFKLKVNSFIDCMAKVVRIVEIPGEKRYEIGCQFIDMSIDNVKDISMFAFKEQLKNKRKELYNSVFKHE